MHFLQMPVEDELIAELLPRQPPGVLLGPDGPIQDPAQQPIPFADTGNPVMAQVGKHYLQETLPAFLVIFAALPATAKPVWTRYFSAVRCF
jgi:hypothetical protein